MSRAILAVLLLAAPGLAKKDDKPKKPTPGEIQIDDPGATIEDPAVAKREVERFEARMKAAADDAARIKHLTKLGGWDHPDVFRAASRYIRDRSEPVAIAAVVACARQGESAAKAGPYLFRAIGREKREAVVCALWIGAARLGYDKKPGYNGATKVLQKEKGEVLKAATRYLGYIKAKQAFRMLAERLAEPTYSRPSGDARKMSDAFWRALHDSWEANRPHVQWALAQLVPGESFETKEEARQWARSEGKKHGIRWK